MQWIFRPRDQTFIFVCVHGTWKIYWQIYIEIITCTPGKHLIKFCLEGTLTFQKFCGIIWINKGDQSFIVSWDMISC